jgi:Na+-transporting NADH:ubiquinone oxidoreductase subunit A
MSKTISLKKGLDIRLVGDAEKNISDSPRSQYYAIRPTDFHGLTPKMVLRIGDTVKAGTIIFHDKYNESICFASPVSGKIADIVRGEKRRVLTILIEADSIDSFEQKQTIDPTVSSSTDVKNLLLQSGCWPMIKQRPFDIIADPNYEPKAIYVSTFDTAPLAPDYNYILQGKKDDFQKGIDILRLLTKGAVHLGLSHDSKRSEIFTSIPNVSKTTFSGKHPAGNVGVQIHHTNPINKGEYVWVVNAQDVAIIGRVLTTGKFDITRTIALTGSEVTNPSYVTVLPGVQMNAIVNGKTKKIGEERLISGNALCGSRETPDTFLGYYDNQVTVLPEGNQMKFLLSEGWLSPGLNKFSNSRLYPTFLFPNKKYRLDTNLNGEDRGFVVTGELEKVFPFDIYPMQLVKAAMTDDIDLMENLGIYEVAPEDFALCEFVCTSKINIQDEIRAGLDLIKKECF